MEKIIKQIVASYVKKEISKELAMKKINEVLEGHGRVCEFRASGNL
ncbi:hypothetical protein [Campylobacter sp.]|nr:hypothetical protein [Campylobacter sp.]MDD7090326.1 hypothetical protein [Campylobacteraceae bacterium]MDY5285938.1 hypothetical protein [Campylobacter sp.]